MCEQILRRSCGFTRKIKSCLMTMLPICVYVCCCKWLLAPSSLSCLTMVTPPQLSHLECSMYVDLCNDYEYWNVCIIFRIFERLKLIVVGDTARY